MADPRPSSGNHWARRALVAWVGLILFSSTSWAGNLANATYTLIFGHPHSPREEFFLSLTQKGFHVFLFAILGVLIASLPGASRHRRFWDSVLCCFAVGLLSEAFQYLFPMRHPALTDVILNGVSGSLGALIALWMVSPGTEQRAT